MERNPTFNGMAQLVEMAEAGYLELPAEVVTAHQVAGRLTAEYRRPLPQRAEEARRRLVESFARAAADGSEWPDGREVVQAEATERAEAEAFLALGLAASEMQRDFVVLVSDRADQIIAGHLRPALGRLMEKVEKVATVLAPFDEGNVESLLSAPRAAREGWLQLDTFAAHYGALRKARSILVRGHPSLDQAGLFAEIRNLHELWPGWRQAQRVAPWPNGDRERMLWLARPEVQVWMPTLAEQDARYREAFAEEIAAAERARGFGRAPLPV